MSTFEIIFGVVLLLFALAIIIVVLLQEGQQQQMGAIPSGNSNTFYEKNKSRSVDAFLARWTAIISIGFALAVIAINVISYFNK